MNYEEAIGYISEVPKFTKKNEAGNTLELLKRLGHPEEKMKVIHVAGTNGKGSVCAFSASILQYAGYKTGLFTSPHLIRINERFQIDQVPVSDKCFLEAFLTVKEQIDEMVKAGYHHPTYFELLFAVGMVIFAREQVEYLVMETGLGGRLDATNTVAHPIVTVITSISLDHTEYLGDTVEEIAEEKAGIIKEGVPVIFDGSCRAAEKVIRDMANRKHAPVVPCYQGMTEILRRSDKSIDFVINNRYYDNTVVTVPFMADYQVMNSMLAMTAVRVLDRERIITDQQIADGIAATRWKGRMETILPDVVLDGAHNAAGIEEFLKTVRRVQTTRRVTILFAAVMEKDYEKMICKICQGADYKAVIVTQIDGDRKVEADILAELFRRCTSSPVLTRTCVREAFETAMEQKGDGVLFCAGSLYLVGEIRAMIEEQNVQKH